MPCMCDMAVAMFIDSCCGVTVLGIQSILMGWDCQFSDACPLKQEKLATICWAPILCRLGQVWVHRLYISFPLNMTVILALVLYLGICPIGIVYLLLLLPHPCLTGKGMVTEACLFFSVLSPGFPYKE